ncbi:MAG TPA: hypothetical protein VK947_13120 [Planococcus sp. (in: firmicutes)]|nr:hypothetical protein [Planococcus sp. (in: firmicutes)]
MAQKQAIPHQSISYFFHRAKDTHIEEGLEFITLFVRLTREISRTVGAKIYTKEESIWVELEEVPGKVAPEKLKNLPNCMNRYKVPEKVFKGLCDISQQCPQELYFLTPFHEGSTHQNFIT